MATLAALVASAAGVQLPRQLFSLAHLVLRNECCALVCGVVDGGTVHMEILPRENCPERT